MRNKKISALLLTVLLMFVLPVSGVFASRVHLKGGKMPSRRSQFLVLE